MTLTDSTHLLVPIHVDALLVGQKPRHFSWADLSPDYTKLERDFFLGVDLRDLAGSSSGPSPGLHLHFKLPAAMTQGTSTAGGSELDFPKLPNRWLVVRYYQSASNSNILTKAWIIRSDAPGREDAVGWPVLPDTKDAGPLRIRRTGECEVLPQTPFKEDDIAAALTITAVGNGDVGFSAHYPACHSILGFHDDLKNPDVPAKTKLSYLVTGWYSAATDDFLHAFINGLDPKLDDQGKLAALQQWLKDKGWSADGLEPGKLPLRMICHGLVRGVDWQGSQRDYSDIDAFDGIESPAGHTVDIGNSSAEALAARLVLATAKKTHSDPELLEDVLTAFQTGLLSHDPTIAELDAELHRQGFVPVAIGKTFSIQSESSESDPKDVAQPHEPVPQHLQDLLRDLNSCQQECDRYAQLKKDYRWELYALWHRWVEKCKEFDDDAPLLKSNLDGLKNFLQNFDQLPQVVDAGNRRNAAEDRLNQALAKETRPKQNDETVQVPKYRLTSSAADRFYAPNDPVVLISGPALERKGTYTPAPEDILPCRVTGQEVLSYSYDITGGQQGIVVTAADQIKSLGIASEFLKALPFFAQQLFSEAMLLEQIKQAGSKPTDIGWRVRPSPDSSLPRIDSKSRMPAVVGIFDWTHNPWIPVYLTWQFEWRSDYAAANIEVGAWHLQGDKADARSDVWKYRRQVDLAPDGPPPAQPTSATYRGYALLARPTFLALAEKLRREPDKVPPRIKEIAASLQSLLENRPMLSQALAGFHDGLIMRRVGDQLPPLDYNRFNKETEFFIDPINEAMQPEDRFDYSPATNFPFWPVRSGRLNLLSLRIIDAFGQAISLDPGAKTPCHVGQRIRADANGGPSNCNSLRLPPRLVRPMRLTFAAAPAGNPTTVAPASSPICGWVVPNQFDQNLTLFAANGKPLGALQRKFELKAGSTQNFFYWVDVPGTVVPETIANLHLRDFARYILSLNGDQGAAFSALLDRALTATEQRVPEEDPGVSVLIGRPLALVRAEVRLEVPGLPALDQKLSWTAKATDSAIKQLLDANGLAQFPQDQLKTLLQTGGAEDVRWPVRLGDRRSGNDGLIGFFAGNPSEASRPFYSSWGFGGTRYEKVLEYEQNLTVDRHHPFQVTLLMDPQARVHATSGVLPKAFLALPHSESAGAKGAREVFFQTAPVLGPPATPQIPKPSDDYGEWSWAYRPDVTRWAEHGDLVSASDRGGFSDMYPTISEGWLKLKIDPVQVLGFWVRDGSSPDHPTLAWSVRGAESLRLFRKTAGSTARVLEIEWSQKPLPREFTLQKSVDKDTTFILAAADDDGYRDEKEIIIKKA